MSAARAKGTLAETAVVNYLRSNGWPHAERRALHGGKDLGDITGCPSLVWEVKNAARITLPEWLRETETERANAEADLGILVVKPKGYGVGQIGEWPAVIQLRTMIHVLETIGYGG